MSDPTVCAVMLTRDRPEFARRAVECFRAQTYVNKILLVWDTGDPKWFDQFRGWNEIQQWTPQGAGGASIGALRNTANNSAPGVDIFAHWDSDDYSHPQRIAEQVALLQASGAECVGYREVLWWDCRKYVARVEEKRCWHESREGIVNEAWLYSARGPSWAIGSSFCYWRRTWERHPFPDLPRPGVANGSSEDQVWRRAVKCIGTTSLEDHETFCRTGMPAPRMICRIHGGNTTRYEPERYPDTWRRVPEWDDYCRKVCG